MKSTSIFTLILLAAWPAAAQNDESWVSAHSGNDANNCTLAAPCRTFQHAHDITNNYGIVRALDAGEYGAIQVQRPITIDGNGAGAWIAVSFTPSASTGVLLFTTGTVEIRNLAIHAAPPCSAIMNCAGIVAPNNNNVVVENVSITGVPTSGVQVIGGTAVIHGVTVTGAQTSGIYLQDTTATISDYVVRYSLTGIRLQAFGAATQVLVEHSKLIRNGTGLIVTSNFGQPATARISDCLITANDTGVSTVTGGQIITFRNNSWAGNGTDGSTPFSASLK